jgi:hypothetical protein
MENNFLQLDDSFNCAHGCEYPNQCYFQNEKNFYTNQQFAPEQQYFDANNNYNNYNNLNYTSDSVVPANSYEMNNFNVQAFQNNNNNHNGYYAQLNHNANSAYQLNKSDKNNYLHFGRSFNNDGGSYRESYETYPPCQGPQPWNFAQCFGYFGDPPCAFADVIDMEDFM